jgi:hypothetical protein
LSVYYKQHDFRLLFWITACYKYQRYALVEGLFVFSLIDYIIDVNSECEWLTVAGIRSTGLTSALGVAHYVFSQWMNKMNHKGTNNSVRTELGSSFLKSKQVLATEARDIITELIRSRNELGTFINIDGDTYPVTHVLSRVSEFEQNKAKL